MSTYISAARDAEREAARERVALIWGYSDVPVTLDGRRAVVSGFHNDFATVQTVCRPRGAAEYAWQTAERILTRKTDPGAFRS